MLEAYNRQALIRAALAARKNAYAPYSGYRVGAALLCGDGEIVTGCNVENASYPVCSCAERTALFSAVAGGRRRFVAIAVVGGRQDESPPLSGYAYPCGVCRQALSEFAPGLRVIAARSETDYREYGLDELLPHSFGPSNLTGEAPPHPDSDH